MSQSNFQSPKVDSPLLQSFLSWHVTSLFIQWSQSHISWSLWSRVPIPPVHILSKVVCWSSTRKWSCPFFLGRLTPLVRVPQSAAWSIALAPWDPPSLLPLYNTFSAEQPNDFYRNHIASCRSLLKTFQQFSIGNSWPGLPVSDSCLSLYHTFCSSGTILLQARQALSCLRVFVLAIPSD